VTIGRSRIGRATGGGAHPRRKVLPFIRPDSANGKHEAYNLDPGFESALVYALCHRPKLWPRLGVHLDPDAFAQPAAKLAVQAMRNVTADGPAPTTLDIVFQRMARMQDEGTCTYDARLAVQKLFEEECEQAAPTDETFIAEMKPVLMRRLQKEAARVAVEEVTSRGDMARVVDLVDKANAIGCESSESAFEERLAPVPADWCTSAPLPRDWILRDARTPASDGVLPRGKVGMLLGEGGVSKTMALIQLGVAVATATPWLGALDVPAAGRVLLVLGEEDKEEVRRRIYHAVRAAGPSSRRRGGCRRPDVDPLHRADGHQA
jgi:hypothetical protein